MVSVFVGAIRPRRLGAKATIGGLAPKALKKENGERVLIPSVDSVETSAIGRGAMPPNR